MAQSTNIKPKEWLLLIFVGLCVVLVILVWWEGITPGGNEEPGFVRATAVFEIDDEAYENFNAPEITATPTDQP
jgi:hypothetical protein